MNESASFRAAADAADSAMRQRARGEARARFERAGARSEAAQAFETGGLRLRFPRAEAECEAVLVNTGGGMAGGDRAKIEMAVGANARAFVTTQSAEKIYRCEREPVRVETTLTVESGGALVWAPQETLLFESAALERRLEADVAADASLIIVEGIVFGRLAFGETEIAAKLSDRWRCDGRAGWFSPRRCGSLMRPRRSIGRRLGPARGRSRPSCAWRPTRRRRRPNCGRR